MPHVVALYRHPVKGFTPERRATLTVQADGRIAGDRVLAFRFADAATPEERDGLDYWPKPKGLALEAFPGLAALQLSFDDATQRMRIDHGDRTLVDAGLDEDGRAALAQAVTDFVQDSPDGRRLQRPGRLPLTLVGDGESARFQDRERGYVSVHSEASVAALGAALGQEIDDRRFRSNVVIGGIDAWHELDWQGEVRIGAARLVTAGPIVRCLATHANPDTGERDAGVLKTLTGSLGQDEPTLGRLLILPGVSGAVGEDCGVGGTIHVGDEVVVG